MGIVVLAKVVPELDQVRFDEQQRRMLRGGSKLFVNPFDQRALAAAGSLRAPGEELIVLSMSPPEGHAPLAELFAHGADRVVVATDPRLSGSDSWVTSKVLAHAVRRIHPSLLFAGRFSTDASTGQLPCQLAEELRWPLLNEVRRVELRPQGLIEATGETEDGWEELRAKLPAVLTISERISKPRKPSPEELEQARSRRLEVLDLEGLGLEGSEAVSLGSPTQVVGLEHDAPARRPVVLVDGSVVERARRARELLEPHLHRPPSKASDSSRGSDHSSPRPPKEVAVLCARKEGGLDPRMLPVLSAIRRLGGGVWPSAIGFGALSPDEARAIASAGALRATWAAGAPAGPVPCFALEVVDQVVRERHDLEAVLLPSTIFGRELAGRLSSRRSLGLVGDVVQLRSSSGGGLRMLKPSFGGGYLAEVTSRTSPALATVRPGVFEPIREGFSPPQLVVDHPSVPQVPERVERLRSGTERDTRFGDLDQARVAVVVGMGLGAPENLGRLVEIVAPLGASIGGTRRVVDAGWMPTPCQVGLTGRFIAPELYLGVGVSGKDNHTVGFQRARLAVGINPDPQAPLFRHVDVGVVGNWEEVLPALVRELAPLFPSGLGQASPIPPAAPSDVHG